ncbi:MAG: plasmid stabilization protein [Rhizobiaceae bacterium]|jgi:plasmid stability protein|nr:plasmid stabilization protein [Rhizobiaceae bacterium]
MSDLLIRGIEPDLKKRLRDNASRNNRSLSQEAIMLLQRALSTGTPEAGRPGDRLLALAQGTQFTSEELDAIEASRSEPDRNPPDLAG